MVTMNPRIPEKNKKPGVCYAVSDDGLELPVIDITHPAFALAPSKADLAELTEQFMRESERRTKTTAFLQRLLLPLILHLRLRRSTLGRGISAARGTFL